MKRTVRLMTIALLCLSAYVIKNDYFPKPKFVGIVAKVMPAVVDISVVVDHKDFSGGVRPGRVGGSGVYVNSKGFILTCGHLFNFPKVYSILVTNSQGETVKATLLRVNFKRDLALLKTDFYAKTPFVRLADPRKLQVGQEVFAVGSPLGFAFSVSNGIISGLYRDVGEMYNTVQSNTAINPGNSGGPLFNLQGELVGVVSFFVPVNMFAAFSGLGFAISPAECLTFLVGCGKDIPEIRSYQWLRLLLSSLGNKKLEL